MPHRGFGLEAAGREGSGVELPIVVVEDDPGMRAAIERVLGLGGYWTSTFPSAESCLEATHTTPVACLVLDIHLPGISGFELYSRLLELDPTVPAVFITGHDDARTRAQVGEAGASAYLAKPFAGRELLRAVERSIGDARHGGAA
jgi:FixJ family two-component response regulator